MKWIDLSLTIQAGMPVYPGDPAVDARIIRNHARDGLQLSRLTLGSHTGTHIDAPVHFVAGGAAIDMLSLDQLCGPALIVACPWSAGERLDLTRLDMSGYLPGDALLLATGWDSRATSRTYFENIPEFAPGSTDWLLRRDIRLFGLDLPTVRESAVPQCPEAMHIGLLKAGVIIVESLANLAPLAGLRVEFQAFPLRLQGFDGSPVRACARLLE
jgi:arylformamidase